MSNNIRNYNVTKKTKKNVKNPKKKKRKKRKKRGLNIPDTQPQNLAFRKTLQFVQL